jgi:predicted RNA-binding Zn ribbon-like protein
MTQQHYPVNGMAFAWHDHHFINNNKGLDFANTVVWRALSGRREDRMLDYDNARSWAAALGMEPPKTCLGDLVVAREAIDSFYRFGTGWGALVGHYAKSIGGDPFLETVLHDAVKLAFSPEKSRVKVCGNCGWLFIDRTRNANKRWCTKDLCGSRTRSRRHYHKRREAYNSAQKA